ncbi:indolepyruvate decarboxylase [Angomonas deanei]|nr:indolepyruvate decarboxylase [Angomonas deanei]|eukprot:EPY35307.1 indolepyruvate decarboxylase [Angomonas deanei]
MPSENYNIGCYLIDRLSEVGVKHLFGVPGDYNLRFLDDVEAAENMEWVGCCNELNAAYAADGYSRCRRIGALLTTYGVGELSAVNGVAGSFAEMNPVIHVVGGPAYKDQQNFSMMHHSLGDGNFHHFANMSEQISCAVAILRPLHYARDIDRVIQEVLYQSRPGYILLPLDVAVLPAEPPLTPLVRRVREYSEESCRLFAAAIEERLKNTKHVSAVVGYQCDRFQCHKEAQALVDDAHIPFAHMLLGKGTLCEQSPNYLGCYYGANTPDDVRNCIEQAETILLIGVRFHDFGTGYFTHSLEVSRRVEIKPDSVTIGTVHYQQVPMAKALEIVHQVATKYSSNWPKNTIVPHQIAQPTSDKYSAYHFWREIQEGLKPDDIIVVDQGTSSAASAGLVLPKGGKHIVQCMWGSIGFSIPAAFGAQVAEPNRRVVLVVGDGSAQMTAQEWGSFLRYGLRSTVFLVNNDGYVIERVIHGWNAVYNDIGHWNWIPLIKALSADFQPDTHLIKEAGSTKAIMDKSDKSDKLVFSEVILGRHEIPVVNLSWKPN